MSPHPAPAHAAPNASLTLPETLRAARAGSTDALATLFGLYARHVFAAAYRITRSADEADDVLQDVFVRLPEALHRFDGRSSFERWLTSVTVRAALTLLRRGRARAEDTFDDDHPAREESEPLERIALAEALAKLPPESRAVLLLRAEGYSHAEIGELLSIRRGTSEVRLFRAREALRALLGGSR